MAKKESDPVTESPKHEASPQYPDDSLVATIDHTLNAPWDRKVVAGEVITPHDTHYKAAKKSACYRKA